MSTFKWAILIGIAFVVLDKVIVFSNVENHPYMAMVYNTGTVVAECFYFWIIIMSKARKWM